MHPIIGLAGIVLLIAVLRDAFETIILPRRISRRFRLTRMFYRSTWVPWRGIARHLGPKLREGMLSWFGPFSLLLLLALWALSIVFAFGLLQWSAGSALTLSYGAPSFFNDIYLSGTTFFTLGMGDVAPHGAFPKALTVCEAGLGFAFLAIVIGYFPVIYQTFSRREMAISLLDARAGSPPTASELLFRHRNDEEQRALTQLLYEWERWAADVLESHISYPALGYFRSQHANQSWLSALTTILDTSALVMVGFEGWCMHQAELTFAMARHAAVDLAQVFSTEPIVAASPRLDAEGLARLLARLGEGGMQLHAAAGAEARLAELRAMYEPYVAALSAYLDVPLAPWLREGDRPDNWQSSPWGRVRLAIGDGSRRRPIDDHF